MEKVKSQDKNSKYNNLRDRSQKLIDQYNFEKFSNFLSTNVVNTPADTTHFQS